MAIEARAVAGLDLGGQQGLWIVLLAFAAAGVVPNTADVERQFSSATSVTCEMGPEQL